MKLRNDYIDSFYSPGVNIVLKGRVPWFLRVKDFFRPLVEGLKIIALGCFVVGVILTFSFGLAYLLSRL